MIRNPESLPNRANFVPSGDHFTDFTDLYITSGVSSDTQLSVSKMTVFEWSYIAKQLNLHIDFPKNALEGKSICNQKITKLTKYKRFTCPFKIED